MGFYAEVSSDDISELLSLIRIPAWSVTLPWPCEKDGILRLIVSVVIRTKMEVTIGSSKTVPLM